MKLNLKHSLLIAAFLAVLVPASSSFAQLINPPIALPYLTYNQVGEATPIYNSGSTVFLVNANPSRLLISPGPPPVFPIINPVALNLEFFSINILVNNDGSLAGGVMSEDLFVSGKVTLPGDFVSPPQVPDKTFTGTLLTGEVTKFGFHDTGGPTDFYDFEFTVTGDIKRREGLAFTKNTVEPEL